MKARNLEPPSLDEARGMLAFVPADERDTWVKLGGILKDTFHDDGFSAWDEWSQTAGNYKARDAADVWRSLGKNEKRAGIGTLVYLARANGWNPAAKPPERPVTARKPPPPRKDTTPYAMELWLASRFDDAYVGSHPYAVRKGIDWAAGAGRAAVSGGGLGWNADCLVIPIRNIQGRVIGVQAISAAGRKATFGKLGNDGCLVLGNSLDPDITWAVLEGWADAVSFVFHVYGGNAVGVVAFGLNRLEKVAAAVADHYHPDILTIVEDAPK